MSLCQKTSCLKSLHHLCAAYDRLGSSSYLVDFRKMDRWYTLAEQVVQDSFAPAASDGQICTALCRCLTCYFYQPSPDRDDPWFTYLTATADAWAAAFSPDRGWDGLPLAEALDRIEVMDRISYMLLDRSRDALLRRAYAHYARRISGLARIPAAVQKRWQLLRTEGNALPLTSGVALT